MRVTNNMILKNASGNINSNKVNVSKTENQMTTQQKISRPSEDPVIAVRSLRLQTTLNKIDQYYERNIPDAESWIDTTATALTNMKSIITDMRTLCVQGSTGTLTADDRESIRAQLKQLQEQIYSEGNTDYAGRTIFTGFRTNKDLIFLEDDADTSYNIDQTLSGDDLSEYSYYTGSVTVPTSEDEIFNSEISDIDKDTYYRLRFAYDDIDQVNSISYTISNTTNGTTTSETYEVTPSESTFTDSDGNDLTYSTGSTTDEDGNTMNVLIFENEDDWAAWSLTQTDEDGNEVDSKYVASNDMVIIKSTGDIIFGQEKADSVRSSHASLSFNYDKTGFDKGELRPEYYYNCTDTSDADNPIEYEKYDENGELITYSIDYTIAQNQTLGVNMEACEIFDSSILQDMIDMLDAVDSAIAAHDKVDKINEMIKSDQYASDEDQEKLQEWLDAANKEMDYYDDYLDNVFTDKLGTVDTYLSDISHAITLVGCKQDQLSMTKTRVSEQQETVEALKSKNDDLDLSEIIINYTAAYTAYSSSLTAAGKLGEQTLLNYI